MSVTRAQLAMPVIAALCSFLVACGGGGSGDGVGGAAVATPAVPPASVCASAVVTGFSGNIETQLPTTGGEVGAGAAGGSGDGGSGAAAGGGLGKVLGGLLRVTDLSTGSVVGEAITDSTSGLVTVRTCSRTGPFLLTMEGRPGAKYFDEGLERLVDFGPGNALHALVDVWDEHVGVSPLTEAAYSYALNNFKRNPADVASGKAALALTGDLQGLTAAQVVAANNLVRDQINARNIAGFDLVSAKSLPLPLDASSSTTALSQTRYGKAASVNGGLVKATQFYNPGVATPALTFAQNLARDMTDGVINGFSLDGTPASQSADIAYDSVRLPVASMVGINAMSQRFAVDRLTTASLTLDEYADMFGVGDWTGLCHFQELAGLLSNGVVAVRRDDKGGIPSASCNLDKYNGILIPNFITDVKLLVGAIGVTYAVKKNGDVYAWGNSRFGSMGAEIPEGVYRTPQLIRGVSNITSLSAGNGTGVTVNDKNLGGVIARDDKGQVWQWGRSGPTTSRPVTRVTGLKNIVKVFSRLGNYFALDTLGQLYAWGSGTDGLLANATPATPVGDRFWLLQAPPIDTPQIIPGLGKVRDLAFVDDTAFALLADGTVYGWGGDSLGLMAYARFAANETPSKILTPTFAPTRISNVSGATDINGGDFTGLDILLSNGKLLSDTGFRFGEVTGALPIRKILNVNGLGGLYLLRDGRAVFSASGSSEDSTRYFR